MLQSLLIFKGLSVQMSKDKLEIVGTGIEGALWQMEDIRQRTLDKISDFSIEALEWHAEGHPNSISTLLYHIAQIEADWLFYEVLGEDFSKIEPLFPYDDRDDNGRLTIIKNISLAEHIERLATIRQYLLTAYRDMDNEQYRHLREVPEYFVSPEWVIHHLCQHESEHLGEIMTIHTLYKSKMAG